MLVIKNIEGTHLEEAHEKGRNGRRNEL